MEPNPASSSGPREPPVVPPDPKDDPLVSNPADRGTPRAALVDAIFSEDLEQCRELLDAHPDLINTPLRHQADLRAARYDAAWGWTQEPFYPNVTPVVFAALAPRFRESCLERRAMSPSGLAIMALLVERGAALETGLRRVDISGSWAQILLIEVCRDYDSPEALSLLIRIGANIHTRRLDDNGHTLLQAAAGRGALGVVRLLLDNGVPMNYPNPLEENVDFINGTPLHWAAKNARHEVVRLLLSRGGLSDLEVKDGKGRTPLIRAARVLRDAPETFLSQDSGREETIRVLVDAGADVTASDGECDLFPDSPLGHVSSWGSGDIIQYLVGRGSDIHQRRSYVPDQGFPARAVGGDNVTPLHVAAHNWNEAGVQALLELGADPGALDGHGRQPLHWVSIGQRAWNWEKHIGRGRPPNRTGLQEADVGAGPVNPAVLARRLAALEATISHLLTAQQHTNPASINLQDALGRTALHYAALMDLPRAAALLVRRGADPTLTDHEGRTALHHLPNPLYRYGTARPARRTADPEGDARLAAALALALAVPGRVDGDACVNRVDNTGATALHAAARWATDETPLALLLRLGADPNVRDAAGSTPLHLAAQRPRWVVLYTHAEDEYAEWAARAARIRGLLVDAGADEGARDAEGRTAGEIVEAGWEEIRKGRREYLVYLARPPRVFSAQFGLNGAGRGGQTQEEAKYVEMLRGAAGAGHGRGG